MSMIEKIKKFISEVKKVVSEITWPDRKTLIQLTIVVLSITIVIGLLLGGADFLFTKLVSWFTLLN